MKLNIKKFMMTEMGGELEETIKAWDQALEERRKATPGIGDPNQGLGFGYWDCTCKSCQDRWEVFKLAIRQFYGIEFNFTRTDEEIVKREIDMEKFRKHLADFNAGIMPGQGEDQSKQRESKVQHKEFGWLSPEGTFTESPFGTHEESAEMICERKGFVDEYWKWVKENGDNEIGHLMRDFLSEVKGYCLIHNPTGCGGYIVTNMKSLTKRQKEFLYGYFMDMGDRFKAEQFIKE